MKRKPYSSGVMRLALGGMMAALVFASTALFTIPVSVTQGYIHLGDGFILLGAALLGSVSVPAAAVGSMLADLMAGYTVYCLPTFLIKGVVAWIAAGVFANPRPRWLTALVLLLSEGVMVIGYFVVEWLVLGYGLAAAAGAVFPNMVQGLSGVIFCLALLPALKRIKMFQ